MRETKKNLTLTLNCSVTAECHTDTILLGWKVGNGKTLRLCRIYAVDFWSCCFIEAVVAIDKMHSLKVQYIWDLFTRGFNDEYKNFFSRKKVHWFGTLELLFKKYYHRLDIEAKKYYFSPNLIVIYAKNDRNGAKWVKVALF